MDFSIFTASKNDNERRFDRVIKRLLPSKNTQIYKAMRKGLVKLNGKKADASEKVYEGDEILIADFLLETTETNEETDTEQIEEFLKDKIILRTDDFLILNKPYDISVQGGEKNLADMVRAAFSDKKSLSFRVGPLHRLDRKTTGVLVFSQSLEGAKWFSEAMSAKQIKKTYIAIAEGSLQKSETWIDFIDDGAEENRNTFHCVKIAKTPQAKKAITTAIPLSYGSYRGKKVTLVEYKIETGRKHQIRAQSAFHGYALLGDTAYGGQKINESQSHFLHAYRIEIPSDNPFGLPEHIDAFIMTNFEKMLSKLLINPALVNII